MQVQIHVKAQLDNVQIKQHFMITHYLPIGGCSNALLRD